MNTKKIAEVFEEIAVLLELKGENPFKVRAFANAARSLGALDMPTEVFIAQLKSTGVRGFGPQLSEYIITLHETEGLPYYEELRAEFPDSLLEFLKIPGLGAKKVKALYEQLKLTTLEQLRAACEAGQVSKLKGFGEKTERNILAAIVRYDSYRTLFRFSTAQAAALAVRDYLRTAASNAVVEVVGSLRRRLEVVRDINLLAATADPEPVIEAFTGHPDVHEIKEKGDSSAAVVLAGGIAADLRVVEPVEFPTALLYFTGSREHNAGLQAVAKNRGMVIEECRLLQGGKLLLPQSEAECYAALGLSYIAPELREGGGEIERAQEAFSAGRELPALVTLKDLRGILHVHSTFSDGVNTIREMAVAVRNMGMQYLGISDHSRSASYAGGLSVDDIKRQHDEIDALNDELQPFRIFKGIESDILADGSLDYDDQVLESFDFVIASVHSRLGMDEKAMTARIIRAAEHPCTTILGHSTGRLLLRREPYAVDLAAVLAAAAAGKTVVEINANPRRLDLDWRWHRHARELGVMLAICPDAHSIEGLQDVRYGVGVARKGGLTAADVLNCRNLAQITDYFSKGR